MPRMTHAKRDRARELRRAMTPAERVLWGHLRNHRLGGLHFRRQHVIQGYIADFYCDAAKLVIEVDGVIHKDQVEADLARDAALAAYGLKILRVTNDDVRADIAAVLERIRVVCSLPA